MMKLKQILCPIALSSDSADALRPAIAIARASDARLIVCHFPGAMATATTEIQAQMTELASTYLHQTKPAIQVEFLLARGSDAAAAITQEATAQQVDLIVMQARRGPLAAALLGSVTEAVCRAAPCAVLVTRPQQRAEGSTEEAAQFAFQRILVAHDFSDGSTLALNWGLTLAQPYRAEFHLLHVIPPDTYLDLEYDPGLGSIGKGVLADIEHALQQELPAEAARWGDAKTEIRRGKPAPEILAYAQQQQVDLLCIGVHDNHKPRGLFGSNADLILRQASCPTLIAQ